MKAIKNTVLIIISILMLIGCIENLNIHGDYNEIDNKYVYCNGSLCMFEDEKTKSLKTLIPFNVVDYDYNDDYIIAFQIADSRALMLEYCIGVPAGSCNNYRDSLYEDSINKSLHTPHELDSLKKLCKNIMKIGECYWIINKKSEHVIGPMNKKEFSTVCNQRNIKLRLDEEKILKWKNIKRQ